MFCFRPPDRQRVVVGPMSSQAASEGVSVGNLPLCLLCLFIMDDGHDYFTITETEE